MRIPEMLAPLSILTMALTFSGFAFADLTESMLIQRGIENPDFKTRLEAQLAEAEGHLRASGRWENPSVEYSRESLDLVDGTSEESSIWLRQRIHIAGTKGLERKAARFTLDARQFEVELAERDWKRLLREHFYQTLAVTQQKTLLLQQKVRLQKIALMVQQRADKGDASRFDALRINKELAVLLSRFTQAQAKQTSGEQLLFALVDIPVEPLTGELLPPIETFTAEIDAHPRLLALESEKQHRETTAKAAGRERWPEVTLALGRKELNEADLIADGNTFAIELEIPIFDRGQGDERIAKSQARQIQSEMILLRRQLRAQYETTLAAYLSHRQAASELKTFITDENFSLSQLAEASYRAGELSVMELLDAYQSDLEASQRFLDTALAARLAYIQLQHLRGE